MRMRGRGPSRALAVAAAVASLTILCAPAASAAEKPKDNPLCPHDSFCLYEGSNFGGTWRYVFPAAGTSGYPAGYSQCHFDRLYYTSEKSIDNQANSMINNTGRYVTLFRNDGCGGDRYVAKPHSEDSTFSNNTVVGGNFINRASGLRYS